MLPAAPTYAPMTELMFHGLPDCTTQATFYGLCSKAGPVRKCMLQSPSNHHVSTISYDPLIDGVNVRNRRVFGLVDYVHPGSVPLAKMLFQLPSYRDAGVLVSDAALSMSHKQQQMGSLYNDGASLPTSTRQMRSLETKENCLGYEVAVYHLHPSINESILQTHFGNKGGLKKVYIVSAHELLACALRGGLPPGALQTAESAALLLFDDYMSAKIATCIDTPGLQLRLIGPLLRNRNASSSFYADFDCYYRGRMITKTGPLMPVSSSLFPTPSAILKLTSPASMPYLSSLPTSNGNQVTNQNGFPLQPLFNNISESNYSSSGTSIPFMRGMSHPNYSGIPDYPISNRVCQDYDQRSSNGENEFDAMSVSTSASMSNISVYNQGPYIDNSGRGSPVEMASNNPAVKVPSGCGSAVALNNIPASEIKMNETLTSGWNPNRTNSMIFTSAALPDSSQEGRESASEDSGNGDSVRSALHLLNPPKSSPSLDHLMAIIGKRHANKPIDEMIDVKSTHEEMDSSNGRCIKKALYAPLHCINNNTRRVNADIMPNATRFVLGYLEDDPMWN